MVQAMKNVQIIIVKVIMGFRSPQKDPTIGGDVCQGNNRMWLLSLVKHPPLVFARVFLDFLRGCWGELVVQSSEYPPH